MLITSVSYSTRILQFYFLYVYQLATKNLLPLRNLLESLVKLLYSTVYIGTENKYEKIAHQLMQNQKP